MVPTWPQCNHDLILHTLLVDMLTEIRYIAAFFLYILYKTRGEFVGILLRSYMYCSW